MKKDEYLKTITEQIRCEKARRMIAEEIASHIDDQADAYMQMGIDKDEALEKAVEEMGDPVVTGVSLDYIHRPKMAWNVLVLIGIISMISALIQLAICTQSTSNVIYYDFSHQVVNIVIGFASMLAIYFVDYSTIGKWGREIGIAFCLLIFINVFFIGTTIYGASAYISISEIHISMKMLMYLYVPIYGSILYQYYGEGYKAVLKSILWMIVPVYSALMMPCASLALNLFIILLMMLTIAIIKNWFIVNKKLILSVMWGIILFVPIVGLVVIFNHSQSFFAKYQVARVKALLNPGSIEAGYQISNVRELLNASKLIGKNDAGLQTYGYLPSVNGDYILTHIMSYYGILTAIILVVMMAFLISRIFKISLSQRNQLGMVMGCGCGLVYSIQVITYVLQNVGLWPSSTVFLPLFSYGGTGTIVSYILLGILLSIYRFQNIIPTKVPKGRKIKLFVVENKKC